MDQSLEDSRQDSAQLRPVPLSPSMAKGSLQPYSEFNDVYEAEAVQYDLRIQLSSVVAHFRARENWWHDKGTENKNQVIAGIFQKHQFELEARQQWEQRFRKVESLVDEAVSLPVIRL